ncbi:hypothetical protein ABXS71_09905 [Bacillus infantis]|jgi:hypothetical protein|uniref:hypothetical protein n=1 Tax=Bacillus infantis TaxID=324767 RepID=UPI00344DB9A7
MQQKNTGNKNGGCKSSRQPFPSVQWLSVPQQANVRKGLFKLNIFNRENQKREKSQVILFPLKKMI